MKKEEVVQKLTEIENKLNALGDIQTKAGEAESLIQRIRDLASQIDQDKQGTSQLKTEIQNISEEIKNLKQPIDEATNLAKAYQAIIDENNKEVDVLKSQLKTFENDATDLEKTIRNQLGAVNAQILSHSFQNEVAKLQKSVNKWFKWLVGSTILLFVTAAIIVVIELTTTNTFWNANFLIKITLTTPAIFFLAFIVKQYSREKRLLDEYTFKSAVALSFEAYRRLVREEGAKLEDQSKIIEFIIASVNNIYSSPTGNMHKYRDIGEDEIDIFGKMADILKKFIK